MKFQAFLRNLGLRWLKRIVLGVLPILFNENTAREEKTTTAQQQSICFSENFSLARSSVGQKFRHFSKIVNTRVDRLVGQADRGNDKKTFDLELAILLA